MLDLLHNKHKLDIEREQALEYRQKFYPSSGGYAGSGAGSVGSHTYGGGGYSGGGGASKTYSPYSQADSGTPSTTLNSKGGSWGPPKPEGSTYNITNNNNINYNYGSNITAISSEGSVPTFQEMEQQRKSEQSGTLGAIGSAISNVAKSNIVKNAKD